MAAQAQMDVGGILRPGGRLDLSTALQPYRPSASLRTVTRLASAPPRIYCGAPASAERPTRFVAMLRSLRESAADSLLQIRACANDRGAAEVNADEPLGKGEIRQSLGGTAALVAQPHA